MKLSAKRIGNAVVGSVLVAVLGGGVIAQQAQPDAGPQFEQDMSVSEPEPTPNPVREQRGTPTDTSGGIDPELGPIAEPDDEDISPALRVRGEGSWQRPQDEVRDRVRREALERAERLGQELNASQANGGATSGNNGPILPVLMPPNIPMVPMELLFPPEFEGNAAPISREMRGRSILVGALDRETRTNTRLQIPSGGEAAFGSLRIKVRACYMSHPEDRIESWAYVEVSEMGRTDRRELAVLPQRNRDRGAASSGERLLRKGWIIASSPSVTPIDHPTYDMWLLGCESPVTSPEQTAQLSLGTSGQRRASPSKSSSANGGARSGLGATEAPANPQALGETTPADPNQSGAPDPAPPPVEEPTPAVVPTVPAQEKSRSN